MTVKLIGVNPNYGIGNSPELYLTDDCVPSFKEEVYTKTGSLYWSQLRSGWTHFLTHSGTPILNNDKKIFETNNSGGFADSPFCLNVDGFRWPVVLIGPWSSGTYFANKYLPKLAMEACLVVKNNNYSCCLTIEKIEKLLVHTKWGVIIEEECTPRLVYNDYKKEDLDDAILSKLDQEFKKAMLIMK